VVESPFYYFKIAVKVSLGNVAAMAKVVFSIGPETLNAIEMISSLVLRFANTVTYFAGLIRRFCSLSTKS